MLLLVKKNFYITLFFLSLFVLPLLVIQKAYFLSILFMIYINALMASSWNVLGGYAGQFSVGSSIFFGIGAYTSALLYCNFNISPWLGIIAGVLVSIIICITIGQLLLKLQTHFFALSTIAMLQILFSLSVYFKRLTGGTEGISIPIINGFKNITFSNYAGYVYLALILLIITYLTMKKIEKSKLGFYFIAIRENENMAKAMGVNVQHYKLYSFSIHAIFISIAGSLSLQMSGFVDPTFAFSLNRSLNLALFSIIGGIGTIFGPILGAFIITPINELLRTYYGGTVVGLNYIIYGTIIIVVALLMPKGIIDRIKYKKKSVLNENLINIEEDNSQSKLNIKENFQDNPFSEKIKNISEGNKIKNQALLEINGLTKYFGSLLAVNNIDFKVMKGIVFGIIGPNGAGKSTIFNLINGFYKLDRGEIIFDGQSIVGIPPYEICKKGISRTFQISQPFKELSTFQNIMIGAFNHNNSYKQAFNKTIKLLKFLDLMHKKDVKTGNLDIFSRKKLEMGKALAGDPKLLLLDEVLAGLNASETQSLISFIKKLVSSYGITIIIIEHKMKAIMNISDRILVLDYGKKIYEGTPMEVCTHESVIEAYLGREKVEIQNK